jgi:hypothetical protein
MKNNIRFVPLQKVCVVCGYEPPARDETQGLAGRLCRACVQLIREQVLREVEANPKIVQLQ